MRKPKKVGDSFIARRYRMLKSPAFQKLSPHAHLILVRLEIEYSNSGGRENGEMICTFRQLREWCGTSTAPVQNAIKELKALGFIKLKKGVSGLRGYGRASRYGLTYLGKVETDIGPTDEWAKFSTTEQVVRAKSTAKDRGKRAPPVCPVKHTITVCPGKHTVQPESTFGCNEEVPVNIENDVPSQAHYLESSKPGLQAETVEAEGQSSSSRDAS